MPATDTQLIAAAAMLAAQEEALGDGEPGGAESEVAALLELLRDPEMLDKVGAGTEAAASQVAESAAPAPPPLNARKRMTLKRDAYGLVESIEIS